jgi:hypothetical protein
MMVLGIILGTILLIVAMIGVGGSIRENSRRKRCKSWKIGDKLALNKGRHNDILNNKHKEFAILKGWDLDNLYIDCGDDMVYQVDWSVINFNKSDIWRKNYENAKKVMGCDPAFKGDVSDSSPVGRIYDGKPIDIMNETECEVYLKKALDEEDYDTAELIKKRMEKFR